MRVATILFALLFASSAALGSSEPRPRLRDLGVDPGILPTGALNAITDVDGVRVGHVTLVRDENIRTGVTAILPHAGNLFQQKVPGALFVGNGFGKLIGATQVRELGEIETPIVLTSTLSVPTAAQAVITWTLSQSGNEDVRSVNALVGETNDGRLNDIRGRHVTEADVLRAIGQASGGEVAEGSVGAGTGTIAFGFKGGIGTSSRKLPRALGGWTVGVLVQSNFGGVLSIAGVPVGRELRHFLYRDELAPRERRPDDEGDGSIMIVVATDAPVDSGNLERMAARAMMGLARTGAAGTNGSGDYAIAFSTHPAVRRSHGDRGVRNVPRVANDGMSPLFLAVIEATEEAILNSLLKAESMAGNGITVDAIPAGVVKGLLERWPAPAVGRE